MVFHSIKNLSSFFLSSEIIGIAQFLAQLLKITDMSLITTYDHNK